MEHRGMIGATWETSRTQPHFRTTWLHSNKKHFSGSVISKNINSLRFFPLPQHYLVPVFSLCSAEEGGLGGEEGGIIVLLVQAAVAAAHAIATGHLRGLRRPPAPFQAPGSPRSRDPTRRWGTALNKWPELLESVEGTDGNPRAGESRYQSTSTYHCRGLRKRAKETSVPLSGRSANQDLIENENKWPFLLGPWNLKIHSHSDRHSSISREKEGRGRRVAATAHAVLMSHMNIAA